jgi:hypothetical protein
LIKTLSETKRQPSTAGNNPEIENYAAVKNSTNNRHGIAGYLDDPQAAQRLLDALSI